MTSNRPLEDWAKLIGDVPAATEILDRFLQHARIITITGKRYRLRHGGKADGLILPSRVFSSWSTKHSISTQYLRLNLFPTMWIKKLVIITSSMSRGSNRSPGSAILAHARCHAP
jgi:hypothetical protein